MAKIVLTFDDNKWNHYHTVFPLLKKYNINATFAYITKGTYTYEENNSNAIREMIDYGIEITSHSHSHLWFDLKKNNEKDIKYDLKVNKEILNSHNIYSYGLIVPYNHFNINISTLDFLNLKYIIYETSTIDNYNPNPKNKLLKFTKQNELKRNNLRRIEFPLDNQSKLDINKFYEIIKNLDNNDICVVMFHNISNSKVSYNVKIDVFEEFIKFLVENKYNITTLNDLYAN